MSLSVLSADGLRQLVTSPSSWLGEDIFMYEGVLSICMECSIQEAMHGRECMGKRDRIGAVQKVRGAVFS